MGGGGAYEAEEVGFVGDEGDVDVGVGDAGGVVDGEGHGGEAVWDGVFELARHGGSVRSAMGLVGGGTRGWE